jgi:hypothetical protein
MTTRHTDKDPARDIDRDIQGSRNLILWCIGCGALALPLYAFGQWIAKAPHQVFFFRLPYWHWKRQRASRLER